MDFQPARIAYSIVFLLALQCALTLWSQAGGQYHLDLMAWYWKLLLPLAAALATVRLTRALARNSRVFTRSAMLWGIALILLAVIAGMVTYYYHLYEPADESGDEEQATLVEQRR